MQVRNLQKLGEGREAEIFAWEPGAVLKLYRTVGRVRGRDIERAALAAARAAHAPAPAALGVVDMDGRPGLIMERADGRDLFTVLDRRPWVVLRVGQTMARCHAALHDTRAPDPLPVLKEHISHALQGSPLVPAHIRQFVLNALERLPDGDRLCHGDFHPGNIIITRRGPVVIDWAGSTRGDPHADVALSLLLLEMGELPEGAPPMIRTLAGLGRRVILGRYLATYRRLSPLDESLLSRWQIVVAAHRLTANLAPERQKLVAVIESAMREPRSGAARKPSQ